MRWFLVLTAAVAAFLLIALGVGLFLPRRSRAAASGRMPALPDRVWALLTDPEGFPAWRPGVDAVELVDSHFRWREEGVAGGVVMEVVESVPDRRWVVRSVEHDVPFSIRRSYDVEPEGGGARVTLIEETETGHPGYRFLFRFLAGREARLLDDLRGMKNHLERERTDPDAPL